MSYLESVKSYQTDLIDILMELLEEKNCELEFTTPFVTTFIYDDEYYETLEPFREVEDLTITGITGKGTVFLEDFSGNTEYRDIQEFDIYDIAAMIDVVESGSFNKIK